MESILLPSPFILFFSCHLNPGTQYYHRVHLCALMSFFPILPIHFWPQFCSCLSSVPALQGSCQCCLLEFTMPRQKILPDCLSLKSCWSPAAPAVHNFIFILRLPNSSCFFFSRAKTFKLESAELEMWSISGWGRVGKTTGQSFKP